MTPVNLLMSPVIMGYIWGYILLKTHVWGWESDTVDPVSSSWFRMVLTVCQCVKLNLYEGPSLV